MVGLMMVLGLNSAFADERSDQIFHPDPTLPLTSLKWQRQQIRKMVVSYVRGPRGRQFDSARADRLYRETREKYNQLIEKMGALIESGNESDLTELSKAVAAPAYELELFLKEKTKERIQNTCWENCRFVLDSKTLNEVGRALVSKYKALPDEVVRAEQVEEEILTLKLPAEMSQLL